MLSNKLNIRSTIDEVPLIQKNEKHPTNEKREKGRKKNNDSN